MSTNKPSKGTAARVPATNDNQTAATTTVLNPKQIALLKAIAAEAADASEDKARLYRWLRETAEAGRALPSFGQHPNFGRIGQELEMIPREVSRRFGPVLLKWHTPFLVASPPEGREPPVDTSRLAEITARIGDGPGRAQELVVALREARGEAPRSQHVAYDWLIDQAESGQTIPVHSHQPNIKLISTGAGLTYVHARGLTWLFVFWTPFFPTEKFPATTLRTELPGVPYVGTAVPTEMLLKRMRAAQAGAADEDVAKLLEHLVNVAEDSRTIPQFNRRPAFKTIMRQAGVVAGYKREDLWSVLRDWLGFFHIDENLTYTSSSGEVKTRRNAAIVIAAHIQELRDAGMQLLERDNQHRGKVSSASLALKLNLTVGSLGIVSVRTLLEGYARECRGFYGQGDGLGEVWDDSELAELKAARKRFREELLEFAQAEIDAGRSLPEHLVWRGSIDYDEFVRRSGRSGPDLRENQSFRTRLAKLRPNYAHSKIVGQPKTYGQLIEELQAERLKSVTTEGSKSVVRSTVKTAIETFCRGLGKKPPSRIEDDFEEPGFEETLDVIIESGAVKNPAAWRREMMKASEVVDAARGPSDADEPFHIVVHNAIRASRRSFRDLAEGTGLDEHQIRRWSVGTTLPTRDEGGAVAAIERKLGLDEGGLAKHIDATRNHRSARAAVPIPAGVREFLPDDYHRSSAEELRAMSQWVVHNLLKSGTEFGARMSEIKREEGAKRRAANAAADAAGEDEDVDGVDGVDEVDDAPADPGKPVPIVGDALTAIFKRETRDLGKAVTEELRDLMTHMTEVIPTLDRRPKSYWRAETTAPMKLRMLARFLRWQILPEDEGGLGRDPKDLTLGDLIHTPLVFAFVDHKAREREGFERDGQTRKYFTGSEFDLVLTVRAMVADVYGFVTQNPGMAQRMQADRRPLSNGAFIGLNGHVFETEENKLTDKDERAGRVDRRDDEIMPARMCGLTPDEFRDACVRAERKYATAQEQTDKFAESGRDPAEAVKGLLDSKSPMETLLRQFAIASQRIPPVLNGARRHHLHVRDLLICRLLALTTLRSKNLRQITIGGARPKLREEDVPQKNGRAAGASKGVPKKHWVLEIPYAEFKNFENAVLFGRRRKRQNYRKVLADQRGLYSLLRYYLEVSRPFLLRNSRKHPDELFLTSAGTPLSNVGMWRAVRGATARWVAWNPFRSEGVEDVLPFGVHVFRDIRATDILLNPRTSNPFLEAALALQTSPGMIQAHYGVVKTEHRTAEDDLTFHDREARAWAGYDDDVFASLLDAA